MAICKGLTLILKSSPEEQSLSSIEEIKHLGLNCCLLQVLTFKFIHLEELLTLIKQPEDYSGMILTSPRTVEALSMVIRGIQEWDTSLCSKWSEKPVFVVGPKTAALTESNLHLCPVGKESGNAASLSLKIIQMVPAGEKPLLFPCGNLKRELLPTTLKQNGINFETINVYVSEPHPHLQQNIQEVIEKQGFPEYIIFYSPSAVKFTHAHFVQLQFPLDHCKLVAIGPSTEQSIEAEGLAVHCTALQPTAAALATAISSRMKQIS